MAKLASGISFLGFLSISIYMSSNRPPLLLMNYEHCFEATRGHQSSGRIYGDGKELLKEKLLIDLSLQMVQIMRHSASVLFQRNFLSSLKITSLKAIPTGYDERKINNLQVISKHPCLNTTCLFFFSILFAQIGHVNV